MLSSVAITFKHIQHKTSTGSALHIYSTVGLQKKTMNFLLPLPELERFRDETL